jgi:hypothetical protein
VEWLTSARVTRLDYSRSPGPLQGGLAARVSHVAHQTRQSGDVGASGHRVQLQEVFEQIADFRHMHTLGSLYVMLYQGRKFPVAGQLVSDVSTESAATICALSISHSLLGEREDPRAVILGGSRGDCAGEALRHHAGAYWREAFGAPAMTKRAMR